MKKTILTILLTILASVGVTFAEKYSGTCGENLFWIFDSETGSLDITGAGAMPDFEYVASGLSVPWVDYQYSIKSIEIYPGVTSIGELAFRNCFSLNSVTIPSSVTSIGTWAFSYCYNLQSITIPNTVTTIGTRAFEECTKLTSMFIPSSVNSIEEYPFAGCTGLTAIEVASDNPNYCSINGVVFTKDKSILVTYPAGKKDEEYTIPSFVTSIAEGAFWGNKNLKLINIPNSVTDIASSAFINCKGLQSVTIPNSITQLKAELFQGCSSLTSVFISSSVTNIGFWAFEGCENLKSITMEGDTPPYLYPNAFYNCDDFQIFVPCGTLSKYQDAENWNNYKEYIMYAPLPSLSIIVDANEGQVTIDAGNNVCDGNIVTITAIPNEHYDFSRWSDGNFDNLRTIILTQDTTFTAIFDRTTNIFNAVAIPERAGEFVFKNGAGEVKPLPYWITENEVGSLEAFPKEGWEFYNWPDIWGSTENPRSVNLYAWNKYDVTATAQFSRTIESNETFYCIYREYRDINYLANKLRSYHGLKYLPAIVKDTYVDGAVVGDGALYFVEYDNVNDLATIGACNFDGKEAKDLKTIVPAQGIFTKIRAIAFNEDDKNLYMVAYDNNEYRDKLLKINPATDNTFTEVDEMAPALTDNVLALAFNKANELYALVQEAANIAIYSLDPASAAGVHVVDLMDLATGYEYYECDMLFSPATDELILKHGNALYLADISTGTTEWISNSAAYSGSIFVGADRYKMSVHPESGQEYWGWVSLTGGDAVAYFLEGEEVQAFAEAYSGYRFVKWADGNTDNPRDYTVPAAETELVAVFEEITKHAISVEVNDASLGFVNIEYYGAPYDAYEGQELLLRADPMSMFQGFVQWDDGNTDNPRTIIVGTEDKTYTAIFEDLPTHTITVDADATYGTAEVSGFGSPVVLPEGVEVNLIATPSVSGYVFDKWEEDDVTDNPRTIKVTGDVTYTALFKAGDAHTITGKIDDEHKWYANVYLPGSVTSAEYAEGTKVKLEVVIDKWYMDSYEFDHWADLSDTDQDYSANPRTIVVDNSDATYEAVLTSLPMSEVHLHIESGQDFWGKVEFVENGSMDIYAAVGTDHQILATPINEKYEFVKWDDGNTDNPRTITIANVETYYTAIFQKATPKHSIIVNVSAGQETWGHVNIEGGAMSGEFAEGESITLFADPFSNYLFKQWSDGITDNPRTIVLMQDTAFTAEFAPNQYSLTIQCDKAYGEVEAEQGVFDYLSEHTIQVNANYGYHLVSWSDGVTDNPRTLILTKDTIITAEFAKNTYNVVYKFDETIGQVLGDASAEYLDEVTFTAVPNYGYHFTQWLDGVVDNPRTIVLTQDTTFTAEWEQCAVNRVNESVIICDGDSYNWFDGGRLIGTYDQTGIYYDTLRYVKYECDSVYFELHLMVQSVIFETKQHDAVTLDKADEYGFNEVGHYVWNDTLRYPSGCDSIVTTHYLEVLPLPEYTIIVNANNAKYGQAEGSGTYQTYSTITISATPNTGYQFNQWSDGNTDNPREITVTADATFTAEFGVKMCSWLVESNDFAMGAVITTFEDEFYKYGTQITVEASPNSGYKFVKWNDGKTFNPYKFSIMEDTYLLAIFMAEEQTPEETEVIPDATSATFTWPLIIGGHTYMLEIYLDMEFSNPFCNILFDQLGQFISRFFFKPAAHRNAQEEGFTYTITDLTPGTQYFYRMQATDELGYLLNTDEGSFTTKKTPTSVDEIVNGKCENVKILRNGHLYILRDGVLYNVHGARVE